MSWAVDSRGSAPAARDMICAVVSGLSAVCSLIVWCAMRLAGEADDRIAQMFKERQR